MQGNKNLNLEEGLEGKLDILIKQLDAILRHNESNQSYDKEMRSFSKLDVLETNLEKKIGLIVEEKLASFHDRLIEIFNVVSSDRKIERKGSDSNERIAQDERKRLKERLKEAVKAKDSTEMADKSSSWMEYIFGICKADGRLGKEGSRLIFVEAHLQHIFSHIRHIFSSAECSFLVITHFCRLIHPQSRFVQGRHSLHCSWPLADWHFRDAEHMRNAADLFFDHHSSAALPVEL